MRPILAGVAFARCALSRSVRVSLLVAREGRGASIRQLPWLSGEISGGWQPNPDADETINFPYDISTTRVK
jgi:hypothetical protein